MLFPWSTQERAEQAPSDMSQCPGRMGKNFHSGKPLPRAAYVHPPPVHPLRQQQFSEDLPINRHTLAGGHGGGLRIKFQSGVGPQTDVQETWRRGPEEHVCVWGGVLCRHLSTSPEWIPAPTHCQHCLLSSKGPFPGYSTPESMHPFPQVSFPLTHSSQARPFSIISTHSRTRSFLHGNTTRSITVTSCPLPSLPEDPQNYRQSSQVPPSLQTWRQSPESLVHWSHRKINQSTLPPLSPRQGRG